MAVLRTHFCVDRTAIYGYGHIFKLFSFEVNAEAHVDSKCGNGKLGGVATVVDFPPCTLHSCELFADGIATVLTAVVPLVNLTKTLINKKSLFESLQYLF